MTPTLRAGFRRTALSLCVLAMAAAVPATAMADWNEAVNGDFSNNGLTPTFLPLAGGSNIIAGTTGRSAVTNEVDRDYFTITVPAGFELTSMEVLVGTEDIGFGSFMGLMSGNTFPISPSTNTAAGMLGWTLFDDGNIGGDLLLFMSSPSNGSSGFQPPLPAGNYSFWVQETGVGVATYRVDMLMSAVPEPATALTLLGGLALLGSVLRRR